MAEDDEAQLNERSDFEDLYYSSVAAAKELVTMHTKVAPSDGVSDNNTRRHPHVKCKLPTITLPKFGGSYDTWLEFRDTFDSLINNDDSIDDVNKFHYLRASLEGSAAVIVQSLALSSSNYKIAWQLLCDRYNNKRLLVNNHIKAIFNITPITKESSTAIRHLIDAICKNIRALATLDEPTTHWDTLLVYIICQKLDNVTRREWEEFVPSCETITFDAIIHFLSDRADLLETMAMDGPERRASWPLAAGAGAASAAHARSAVQRVKEKCFVGLDERETDTVSSPLFTYECPLCKRGHWLFECPDFLALSNQERADKVQGMKVCLNCLKPGHIAKYCRRGPCKSCSLRHSSLIHVDRLPSKAPVAMPAIEATPSSPSEHDEPAPDPGCSANGSFLLPAHPALEGQVILSTALVEVYDRDGKPHMARAFLDNGSSPNFIRADFCKKLNLPIREVNVSLTGIQNIKSTLHKLCDARFSSLFDKSFSMKRSFYVVPQATCDLPLEKVNVSLLDIPKHLVLADPQFHSPAAIDLLLGAEVFWELVGNDKFKLGRNKPIVYETKLGWVVSGHNAGNLNSKSICCNFVQMNNQDDELTRFWKLDEATIKPATAYYTNDERACEEHFVKNTSRLPDGRFMVRYPLKQPASSLGDSYERAKQCFLSLERRLERQPQLKPMYKDFMNEYETLGDMSKVTSNEIVGNFLPFHGVLRLSSLTTKLRVVFNASARTSTGVTLNDIQYVGPTIQDDLIAILLRFRQYRFVYTADVEKMYRRIVVHPDDRYLQQIIWRKDPSEPLCVYKLNTVTYGTASAPFLAVRCLKQLSLDCSDPRLTEIIAHDFYMDDFLSGSDTEQEATSIITQVSAVLKSAGMNLRKWRSNEPRLITEHNDDSRNLNLGNLDESKTLGLGWKSGADVLYFTIDFGKHPEKITKRFILSTIAKIFDPLGLLSPVVIQGKILLQLLWLSRVSWDDEVPQEISQKWHSITMSLPELNHLCIPRSVVGIHASRVEFHIFTDASQSAYGACLYVRTITNTGVVTRLLMAKSRVAPLRPVTIPRMELCGALIGAQLYQKALISLRMKADSCTFWTDSMIVLGWLRMLPTQLKVFVRNRVADILEITGGWPWRHVPTKDNPADLVSRGLDAGSIAAADIWWNGPAFLRNDEEDWPKNHHASKDSDEVKAEVITANVASEAVLDSSRYRPLSELNLTKFSNFTKLKRVTAYVLRFINNARPGSVRNSGFLNTKELHAAMNILVKLAQIESFCSYDDVKNKTVLKAKDPLTKLNPFVDSEGLMRVGGRLRNGPFSFDKKHPAILPKGHFITVTYFNAVHIILLHAGPQAMLAYVKSTYWPIGGRTQARSTYYKCILCTRMRGATIAPLMGNLPSPRVTPGFPFEVVGVDYAGPILAASRKGRGSQTIKVYIVIFVCFKTKCVHLELCSDLSAEGYMAALKRFVSRRGLPSDIYSDNGTQFVGAYNDLKRFLTSHAKTLSESAANAGIRFHFIPPYSPHFGGLWEAGVKSTKHHLVRVLGNCHLTFEEIYCALCQIEAILNARPLTPLTSDPSDLLPLTPGHFLIGRPLTALPTPCLTEIPPLRLTRYQRIEQLRQHYWVRWYKEYVSELQERTKWRQAKGQLATDTMVVVKEDNLPPMKWKLGRIVSVIPGSDGINRVADIRTSSGIIRRAFSKICPLPVEN
ncbi:uncharacterized protein LOC134751689 isoform X1 [Cydia strobilella]|uniref:uncharacterized protein LOC134751689 isoform X1 n=1 Tax=Cydia strobilella TaxID=1100964 RepID=UPI0030050BD4